VDGIIADLLAPLLEANAARGWSLLGWDAEQGVSLTLQRGQAVLLIELEARDDAHPCYARTDRFNVLARRQFEAGVALDAADRRLVDAIVELIRRREASLPVLDRLTTSQRVMVRELQVERALVPEGRGHYYLNPYVGCTIGCEFCYVARRADLSRGLEGMPHLPWGRYLDIKINAAEVLAEEVKRLPPGLVRISPILTDPYQPVERTYRVTRQCLEVLLRAGFVPAILTRCARVLEDLDLIREFPRAMVGFSIPSDDDHYRQIFEPGADSIEERLTALARLADAGISTSAVIQPMLPMNGDRLVDLLAGHIRAVRVDRMHQPQVIHDTYATHGLEHFATDEFFDRTRLHLESAFRSRGVLVDEMDDLIRLLDNCQTNDARNATVG
jgi:DNA repair photolyase